MEQQNQGKITIHQGEKNGDELLWGLAIAEKEYLYLGQAREALESFTWKDAETLAKREIQASFAILIKAWGRAETAEWDFIGDRIILLFTEKEKEGL